jgi:hypothetical protein
VAYFPKARTVEPEKRQLLGNVCVTRNTPPDGWPDVVFLRGVRAVIKDPTVEKSRQKGPECKNGIRKQGLKEQLRLGNESVQQDRQADCRTGGRETGNWVFRRAAENGWQDIVEDSAPTQTEEEATRGLRAGAVGAPTAPEYYLSENGRNGDTPVGYSGRAALRMEKYSVFAQSKNCGAGETAIAR